MIKIDKYVISLKANIIMLVVITVTVIQLFLFVYANRSVCMRETNAAFN